jgi:8-oxo-dGTP pyrophosphatase MutT (NUDIX family)
MTLQSAFTAVLDRFASPPSQSAPVGERQSGVIPYSIVDATPVFLLITSRRTGRWIFPKGGLEDGLEPWESAQKEAFDEAGVEGVVETVSVGSYRTWKTRGVRRFAIEVDMYPFRVERQFDDWLETGERHRHWVTLPEASRLIANKRLVELAGIVASKAASDISLHTPAA